MSLRTSSQRPAWIKRAISLLLTVVMVVGLLPAAAPRASAHWADAYLDQLVDWGVLRADQTANPDAPLTRAEFMAVINRAYGYTETGAIPFTDVVPTDWFYDDVSIAYTAGYMAGTSETTASPNDTLTREQAVCILGRNMMLEETPGESLAFSDSRDVSSWARGTLKTAVNNYIVSGYPDNSFHPLAAISKAQMAVLVTQCVGTPVSQSGTYSLGGVFGNVTITAPNVTLRDATISGDLYISGGVGLGGIKLENVNVLGRIIVSGTGESEAGDASVVMRNVTAEGMLVDNMRNKTVTIRADGITDIKETIVRTPAYLEDNNTDDKGLMHITLDGEDGTHLTLAGRIKEVTNKTPNSTIQVAKGTVAKLTVDEAATNSVVQLDRNTVVKEMNLDVGTSVVGEGDIEKLNINAPGSVVSMLPDKIYIRPGLTANIAGVIMDHVVAEEGSTDPRLLSGYPAAKDIAPTAFRADFAGNKQGTIYWAVSAIADGSIGEDDLIAPPSYGNRAVRNGSVTAPTGGDVVSSQVTGLTVGGSYYLSAILVDSQQQRSPVKVISFSTPDNTVPAFAQGYPYMSLITDTEAQVTVMPTKTCKMYFAVLPRNAQAPTANDMKSAAVTNNLGYGVVDVEKNKEEPFMVSHRLEELKDYTLYLWLTDIDGANSSAVIPVQFTAKDMTPPEFVVDLYEAGQPQANSIPLAGTLNENGTVFWAVVEEGANYPRPSKDNPDYNTEDGLTAKLDSYYAKFQVSNGMNCLQRGQVAAQANQEFKFNVTGLQPEKAYDLYYLAQDTAGNYSIIVKKIQGGIHTLDTSRPTIRQWFTSTSGLDETIDPMPDTDIVLEFSENVAYSGNDLLTLYAKPDKTDFINALHETISMWEQRIGTTRPNKVYDERDVENNVATEDQCVLDYTQAKVEKATDGSDKVNLIFPNSGLKLSSGTTYYFQITKITDNSTAKNEIRPLVVDFNQASIAEGHKVPRFTVASARLSFTPSSLNEDDYPFVPSPARDIEFSFYMNPESTKRADENLRYDLLFWSESRISFDLYYRMVDAKTLKPITDSNGNVTKYPELPSTATEKKEDNGWLYLGPSGGVLSPAPDETKGGVDLHKQFNHCTGASFPRLHDLDDSGQYLYEFAVSVTQIGTVKDRTAWSDPVNFYVNAASATRGQNLDNLANLQTEENWRAFREDLGMAGGGGASIGVSTVDGSDTLKLNYTFTNSQVPTFTSSAPTFKVGDSSVEIGINMNLPGTVYYLIAPVAPEDVTTGISSITTRATLDGTTYLENRNLYLTGKVPTSGGSTDPNYKNGTESKWVSDPVVDDVRFPPYTNSQFKKGSYSYSGGQGYEPIRPVITGLMPNQEYYCYMVLMGANPRETSQVYLYTFKTSETAKPRITLDDKRSGKVEISTSYGDSAANSVEADLKWRVFTQTQGQSALKDAFTVPTYDNGTSGNQIKGYTDIKTVLKALTTKYYASTAYGGTIPGNAKYGREYDGFTVFDVFASITQKRKVESLVSSPEDAYGKVNNNTAETRVNGAYIAEADWVTNGTGVFPEPARYLILVAGHNINSTTGDSDYSSVDSFAAYDGVVLQDLNPPKLLEENGVGGYINESGGKLSGEIFLQFDKPLYWRPDTSTVNYAVKTGKDAPTVTGDVATVGVLYNMMPAMMPTGSTLTATVASDTINISFKIVDQDVLQIRLLTGGRIVSNAGNPANSQITITIRKKYQADDTPISIIRPNIEVTYEGGGGKIMGEPATP